MTQNTKAGSDAEGSEPFVVLSPDHTALVHGGSSGKNDPPPPETREGGPKVGPGMEFRD